MDTARRRLRLNASVCAAGHILVEVGDQGMALPDNTFSEALPILGDSPDHRVAWRGEELRVEPGQCFTLRFGRRCGRLFSFRIP